MSARDLLAQATPRPWRLSTVSDNGETLVSVAPSDRGPAYVCITGGDEPSRTDAELIVRAANEYEALLDIADAAQTVRSIIGPVRDEWEHVDELEALEEALARLDALRSGT